MVRRRNGSAAPAQARVVPASRQPISRADAISGTDVVWQTDDPGPAVTVELYARVLRVKAATPEEILDEEI